MVSGLPNGIRYIGNYTHDMRFICTLDSDSYEITNITYISGTPFIKKKLMILKLSSVDFTQTFIYFLGPVLTSDSGQTRISFEMVFISVFFFFGK